MQSCHNLTSANSTCSLVLLLTQDKLKRCYYLFLQNSLQEIKKKNCCVKLICFKKIVYCTKNFFATSYSKVHKTHCAYDEWHFQPYKCLTCTISWIILLRLCCCCFFSYGNLHAGFVVLNTSASLYKSMVQAILAYCIQVQVHVYMREENFVL